MLHDQHLKVSTDFNIPIIDAGAGGLFPSSAIDLKSASRIIGNSKRLSFYFECTESLVIGSGAPYCSFMAVVSDSNTLTTNTVVLGQTMPWGSALSLSSALPKVGDRYEMALCQGHLGGKATSLGGSGVLPGHAAAIFARRYLGVVYINSPKTLAAGGTSAHAFSAGKFDIWLGASSDSGGVIFPSSIKVT